MKVDSRLVKFNQRALFLPVLAFLTSMLFPTSAAGQATAVQVNSNPFVSVFTNSVAVPYSIAQTVGNLNIVVVGWNDTTDSIASVTDTNGNTYTLVASTLASSLPAPGASQETVSQAIYYAKNIKAGPNTVTVTFNENTLKQSVRIVEYSGLDPVNPVDSSAGSNGSANPADSSTLTTNSANDLLFAAGTITTVFSASGPSFSTILLNGWGDIIEDEFVIAAGNYNATAVFGSGDWVMQLVAFRAAGQTPPLFAAPVIASLSVASSPEAGGVSLTITGTNFEPGATVVFSNLTGRTASAVNCSVTLLTAPNATISCLTPAFPTGAADITVTNVDGQVSASFPFSYIVSTPFATAATPVVSPSGGVTNGGNVVAISGSDFAAGAKVTVGGIPADRVWLRNVNTIQASMPALAAGSADVVVTNSSGTSGTLAGGYTYVPATGISFVQVNSSHPASPAATAPVDYLLPQTAGNLNVVVIGWGNTTSTVQSVTDTAGNTYTPALSPTVGGTVSQTIYYSKNINPAVANTVTVTFGTPAASPDVRIVEYSGLDTVAPLDDASGDFGTGTALAAGPITTTATGDLVIGSSTVGSIVSAAGAMFTTVTATPNGLSVEHLVGPAAGTVNPSATQQSSANWVMQSVAFRQAGLVQDFSISVTPPTSATVAAGSPATFTVSVGPINGFNSPVSLTCSGLPLGAKCNFVPSILTPVGTPLTSALTITTSNLTPVATSSVTVTGTYLALSHDTIVGLAVTPTPPDFTISASALSPASVEAGGTATSPIVVGATGGFSGAVSLTCSVAPAATRGPTCSLSPASLPAGSGTSTLTVSTWAATTAFLAPQFKGALYALWLPVGALALLGASIPSPTRKLWTLGLGCLMFLGLIFLAACGGSSSGGGGGGPQPATPSGAYTITVTGTSGSLTDTATLTLTVQ
jgi:IPT/TIG domain